MYDDSLYTQLSFQCREHGSAPDNRPGEFWGAASAVAVTDRAKQAEFPVHGVRGAEPSLGTDSGQGNACDRSVVWFWGKFLDTML